MKYKYLGQSIPQDTRRELNDKLLYLVDNDLAESSGITCEDIYNAYTGDGGLHGLRYSDYSSYSENMVMKVLFSDMPAMEMYIPW